MVRKMRVRLWNINLDRREARVCFVNDFYVQPLLAKHAHAENITVNVTGFSVTCWAPEENSVVRTERLLQEVSSSVSCSQSSQPSFNAAECFHRYIISREFFVWCPVSWNFLFVHKDTCEIHMIINAIQVAAFYRVLQNTRASLVGFSCGE